MREVQLAHRWWKQGELASRYRELPAGLMLAIDRYESALRTIESREYEDRKAERERAEAQRRNAPTVAPGGSRRQRPRR